MTGSGIIPRSLTPEFQREASARWVWSGGHLSLPEEMNDGGLFLPGSRKEAGKLALNSDFVKAYVKNSRTDVKQWLPQKIHEHLPDLSAEETDKIVSDITLSIKTSEESKKSLEEAKKAGQT